MATDLKSPTRALPRHEVFVDEQLARASRRIHALDLGRTLLWLLAATLLHSLVMAGLYISLDSRPFNLGWALQVGVWSVYLGFVTFLLGKLLFRYWSRINPYYAARQIEEAIPGAKNSVVNWLDLRRRLLPTAIRDALGLRAARDLKTTDPDRAVNSKHGWTLIVLAGVLLVAMVALFIKETDRFGSLMGHAFYPLGDVTLTSRTKITLQSPARGNVTVAPQEQVSFQVRIVGDVPHVNTPQSPRLLYRYHPGDSWAALALEPDTTSETRGRVGPEIWAKTILGDLVQNGFSYKIVAGDAETPQYQVTVYAQPEANRFEITHHYRPYLRWPDDKIVFPNQSQVYPSIKKLIGTEVTVQIRTNRELQLGKVELKQGKDLAEVTDVMGEVLSDDPRSFRAKFKLEKPGLGKFRVRFTSRTGEDNTDNYEYDLDVLPDHAPNVVLTKPAQDVKLPANGTLLLEGQASDDFGVRTISLHMEIVKDQDKFSLIPKIYRPDKSLKFADGFFPDRVEYKDFVALDKISKVIGGYQKLSKGDVLSYWLEATDNFEYPEERLGQIGKSKPYQVIIVDPQNEEQQKSERHEAEQEQKQHEKRQDEDLKQQKQQQQARGQDKPSENTPEQKQKEKDFKDKLDSLQKDLEKQKKEQKEKSQQTDPKEQQPDQGPGATKDPKEQRPDQGPGATKDPKEQRPDQGPGATKDPKEQRPDQGPGATKDPKEQRPDQGPGATKDPKEQRPDQGPGATKDPKEQRPDQGPGATKDPKEQRPDQGPGATKDPKEQRPDQGPGATKDPKEQRPDQGPGATKDPKEQRPDQGPGATKDPKEQRPDQGSGATKDPKEHRPDQGSGATKDPKEHRPDQGPGATKDPKEQRPDQGPGATKDPKGQRPDQGPGATKDPKEQRPDQGPGATKDPKEHRPDQGPGATKDPKEQRPDQGPGATKDPKEQRPDQGPGATKDPKEQRPDQGPGATKDPKEHRPDQGPGATKDPKEQRPDQGPGATKDPKEQRPDQGPGATKDPKEQRPDQGPGATKDPKEQRPDQGPGATKDPKKQRPDQGSAATKDPKEHRPDQGPGATKDPKEQRPDQGPGTTEDPKKQRPDQGPGATKDPKASQPDPKAARRGGNMTYEDLKNVTPEMKKKAGFANEKEWQQFEKDYKAYQEKLRRQQVPPSEDDSLNKRGDPRLLPNTSPSLVEPTPNAGTSSLQNGRGQPPPGFREVYQPWTTRPQPKE